MIIAKEGEHRNRVPTLWVPEGFVPADYAPRKHADCLRFALSTIARKTAYGETDPEGWAVLHSKIIERLLNPSKRLNPLKVLAASGVVDVDKRYVPGQRSKGYRLTPEWAEREVEFIPITDPDLLGRWAKELERLKKEERGRWQPVHWRLRNTLEQRVRISEGAEELASAEQHKGTRAAQRALIAAIRLGCGHYSVSKWGRMFTPVSGMLKTVRKQCLTIDEQPTAELDITACQPALLAWLMKNYLTLPHVSGGVSAEHIFHSPWAGSLPPLPLPSAAWLPVVAAGELADLEQLVESGGFTDWLVSVVKADKVEVKRDFLKDVVARKGRYVSPVASAFRYRFPGIWQWIRAATARDYRAVIRSLQLLESWLMFRVVVPRCPFALVSVHDALLCRSGDAPAAARAFREGFQSVDLRASFKVC